nr:MAG TPA: tail tape measure [Caudoviricetes sp.]
MADGILENLMIRIGLDVAEMQAGLRSVSAAIERVSATAENSSDSIDRIAATASKTSIVVGRASDDVADRIMEIGTAGQKAALTVSRAMDTIGAKASGVTNILKSLGGPLLAAFAGQKLFQQFSQGGDALAKLSDRLGMSAQKIDAWAKANEDAGGSQEAFKGALENFILTTGKGEEEFFRMGEHIKGLNQRQAEWFLKTQGLSADSAAVFLKYRDSAKDAAKAFEGVAMTDEQVKIAREFNRQWKWFTNQASSLGGILMTVVMPVMTKVLKALSDGVKFLSEHSKGIKLLGGMVAAVFGASYLKSVLGASKAFTVLMSVVKGGMPVMKGFNAIVAMNPVGATIAAVVALGLALDDLFAFLRGGNSLIGKFLSWIGLSDKQIDNLRKRIVALGEIPEHIANEFKAGWQEVKAVVSGFANLINFEGLTKAAKEFWEGMKIGASMIGSFIAAPFKMLVKVMDGVEKFFTGLPSAISGGFDAFAKHLYESFLAIFITPIKDAIASIFDIDFGKVADTAKGMADKAVGKVKSFFGFGDDDEKKEEPKQQAKTKRAKPKADQDDFNARYEAYLNRQMDEEERRAFGQPESPPPRNAELSNRQLDYMKSLFTGRGQNSAEDFEYINKMLQANSANSAIQLSPEMAGVYPAGALAASTANANNQPQVKNNLRVTVETHIQTDADPKAVGEAVSQGVNRAMMRGKDLIANAATGVVQKG